MQPLQTVASLRPERQSTNVHASGSVLDIGGGFLNNPRPKRRHAQGRRESSSYDVRCRQATLRALDAMARAKTPDPSPLEFPHGNLHANARISRWLARGWLG